LNETRLNLGMGMRMGINHWEWERMGLKKTLPLISSRLTEQSVKSHARQTFD